MDNILLLERLRNIKEEAAKNPQVYQKEAHKYFDEFIPVLEALLAPKVEDKPVSQPQVFKPIKKK